VDDRRTVLLKLSGEGFAPDGYVDTDDNGRLPISPGRVDNFGRQIMEAITKTDCRLAIVVGGGNIWRGGSGVAATMDRNQADMMGMLATVINSLALRDALKRHGATDPRVMSRVSIHSACEDWIVDRAMKHLDRGRIIICAAGTGEPNFTTDTAAVQRARNITADIVL
jgi:uridylate kinase